MHKTNFTCTCACLHVLIRTLIFNQLYFCGCESWPNCLRKEVNWWWIFPNDFVGKVNRGEDLRWVGLRCVHKSGVCTCRWPVWKRWNLTLRAPKNKSLACGHTTCTITCHSALVSIKMKNFSQIPLGQKTQEKMSGCESGIVECPCKLCVIRYKNLGQWFLVNEFKNNNLSFHVLYL